MRRSPASLVALALLLGAYVARAQHSATAAPSAVTNVSYCEMLANITGEGTAVRAWRSVPFLGVPTIVTLLWDNELGHAAAVMLGVLLRHVHLYDGVHVSRAPYSQVTAAKLGTNFTISSRYLVIAVSATWMPETRWSWQPKLLSAATGPRPYSWLGSNLRELGESTVPAQRRLFAWLNPTARNRTDCWEHMRWAFYANQAVFVDCGFVGAVNPQGGNLSAVEVLGVGDCNTTLQQLQARATATKTTLHLRHVDRTAFMHILQTTNRSFLFLDYDMWKGVPGVIVVEPPPCVPIDFDCKQELDSAKAMLVANVDTLEVYAPQLLRLVQDFKPSPKSLRLILERQASGVDIEEAGCEWAFKNISYLVVESNRLKYDKVKEKYVAVIYLCLGDPSNLLYEFIINRIGQILIIYDQMSIFRYNIELRRYFTNCSDIYNMFNRVHKLTRTTDYYRLVGVVSMVVEGAAEASAIAAASHVPLMLADVVPEEGADLATWRVAGRPRHIARALQRFVRASDWTRIAVLFQSTKLAADYNAALKDKADIILGDFPIPDHLTEEQTQTLLRDLQNTNARIVFVNADSQAALTILTAASAGGMGYSDGFVWIVREWQQNNVTCATNHYTVSFWDRGLEDIPAEDGWEGSQLRKKLRKVLAHPWPPRAVSLANALLTLVIGFKDIFSRFPYMRKDLHSAQIIRLLHESLIETPVAGVSQRLRYKERSLEEAFVFVDQWCGSEFKQRLATWRVNATSGEVRGNYSRPADLPHDDGTSACIVRSGDEFNPTCHDIECACALLLLALAPGAVLLARRALRRHLARLQQEQQIQVIARRRHVTNVLAAYLVERAALELHEELGAGKFGSVRLARLREPAHAPRYIAVKALRDNAAAAEESEFLREACTIASLNHAHIVRLVGVCIADGPPLVLMELAFFGDLLGYLCARRYLVEGASSEASAETGEAEHVSAKALTRLAREAAEALQYLDMRGVVHRDVRAANCLVDVRRSLKLADFGMARNTVASADGAPEYSCRRRGLFPVLWMAPESLAHGVFTAASDVWALGVLVMELVTLGVRPYGTMSPLRVLEYVAAGGSPPLPLDATRQTRGLAQLCWAREAERRPSAAEVAAYLASWPLALRPALLSERDEPADTDSSRRKSSREVALHKAAAARLSSPLPRPA